jgi:enoyl-CoA hydratase/carnithine racemase
MASVGKPQVKRNAKPKPAKPEAVLLYEVRDEIAFITMNRPEKLNALNGALSDALRETWLQFEADSSAKVAVLTGAGQHFCAGADVSPGAIDRDVPFQVHQGYPQNGITVFKPIVGAIRGYVLGAGYALAVRGCDITIAGESTLIGFPEARIGTPLPPIEYLPYMPFKISLEFMLLAWNGGQIMDAHRAYEVGLVNKVVADEQLMDEAVRWAELLKKIPPLYIKSVKYGHYKTTDNKVRVDEREYILFTHPQEVSRDRQEGLQSFLQRREPKFTGR